MAPIVHEYEADTGIAGPQDTRQARETDTGGVGDALSRLGGAVSQTGQILQQREAQAEISDLASKMAQAHADFSVDLDDRLSKAELGDRTVAQTFMQDYDNKMGDIEDNVSTPQGRAYFQKANAMMRGQLFVSAMKGQANNAGAAAVSDYRSSLTSFSSSLINDPSAFETVRGMQQMQLDAMVKSGSIPSTKAAEMQQDATKMLAVSAVRGWIGLDPNVAKAQLSQGQWDQYVDGQAKFMLDKEVEQGISAKLTEQKRQQDAQRQALADQQNATQNKFLANMQQGNLTSDDILKSNLDPFGSGSKEQFLKMLDTSANGKLKTDASTLVNLFDRIHLPDTDPNKITDENQFNTYLGKGLDFNSLNQLRTELQGKKTPDGQIESQLKANFLESVKGSLVKANPMMGIRDPQGEEQYQKFLTWFLPEYQKQKAAGKSPINLLNPDGQDYMGKSVPTFMRTPQQIMQSMMPAATPSASPTPSYEPRKQGESAADYLKRTGKQ